MIKGFRDKETEKIYSGIRSAKLPGNIQEAARRKLKMLHAAADVTEIYGYRRETVWKRWRGGRGISVFGSTSNGGSHSDGMTARKM